MLIGYIRRPERGDTFKKPPSCWLVLHGERKGEVFGSALRDRGKVSGRKRNGVQGLGVGGGHRGHGE